MTKTSEPLPYYKWLWRDWRADRRVQKLNYVAQGLYRSLLDEQWCEGGLPTSVEDLSDICGCPVEVMQENWTALSKFFEETEPGVLANSKLEKQRTEQDKIRAAKSRGGRASALQKLSKVQHLLTPVEDSLVFVAESHIAEQSRADTEQSRAYTEHGVEELNSPLNGQEGDMKLKPELTRIAAKYGAKAGGYDKTWEEIKLLGQSYGTGAVSTDFERYMQEFEGDDFPVGAVVSYLRRAADRLKDDSVAATAISQDPKVKDLIFEIIKLSDGKITPQSRHRFRMSEILSQYSLEEVVSAFKRFLEDNDPEDQYQKNFYVQNFLDAADGLCRLTREKKKQSEQDKAERETWAKSMQEQAEQERLLKAQQEKLVDFDPLLGI